MTTTSAADLGAGAEDGVLMETSASGSSPCSGSCSSSATPQSFSIFAELTTAAANNGRGGEEEEEEEGEKTVAEQPPPPDDDTEEVCYGSPFPFTPAGGRCPTPASSRRAVAASPGTVSSRSAAFHISGTSLAAALSLRGDSVHLSFKCAETADVYEREIGEDEARALEPRFFTRAGALYSFLEDSLRVAAPWSLPRTPTPGSLTCAVWRSQDEGQRVLLRSTLHPSHSFIPAVTLDLDLPCTGSGGSEERHAIQIAKLAQEYEDISNRSHEAFQEALVAQEVKFREALAAQEKSFQTRLADAVATAVGQVADKVRSLEGRLGSIVIFKGSTLWTYQDKKSICTAELPTLDGRCDRLALQEQFDQLPLCTNLQRLSMRETQPGCVDFDFLAGLTGLTELNIYHNLNLSDLSPLEGLTRLQTLNLFGCENVTDMSVLASLPMLTYLNIAGCGVTGLEPLANRPDLRVIR